jgi:hypothetical protein
MSLIKKHLEIKQALNAENITIQEQKQLTMDRLVAEAEIRLIADVYEQYKESLSKTNKLTIQENEV